MRPSIKTLHINDEYSAPLSRRIQSEFNALTIACAAIPVENWQTKSINADEQLQSPQDIIAYQIGWGKLLLSWYNAGITGVVPTMPGEGFNKWDYQGLAKHFCAKYAFANAFEQYQTFRQTVVEILNMCETEYSNGNLDKLGVWPWCTLKSGKKWPLSKWIQVNTVAPYKRARSALKSLPTYLTKE